MKASRNQMFDKSEQDSSVWHRIEKLSKDNYMAAVRLQARAQNEGWSMGNIGQKLYLLFMLMSYIHSHY